MKNVASRQARRENLGDVLVKFGMIGSEQLHKALKQTGSSQDDLGQVLVKMGIATEEKVAKATALRLGVPFFKTFDGMINLQLLRNGPLLSQRLFLSHLVDASKA